MGRTLAGRGGTDGPLEITLFTDPACPFAFSAEPVRMRLRWHYGDGLRWTVRMIVLTREAGRRRSSRRARRRCSACTACRSTRAPYPRPASSEPACRAVVAAREHAPERAEALLRRLRVRVMTGGLVDDPELIAAAARDAGLDPARARALDRDGRGRRGAGGRRGRRARPAARRPRASHKLGGPGRRAPLHGAELRDRRDRVPGFNPVEVYETAIANLAPELPRRPRPESVRELLGWAGMPLATAEVALVMGTGRDVARRALEAGAREHPAGADAYWTIA